MDNTEPTGPGGRKDLTGQRFGSLVVTGRTPAPPESKGRNAYWVCLCDCGRAHTVRGSSLTGKITTRCLHCSQATPVPGKVRTRRQIEASGPPACPLVIHIQTVYEGIFHFTTMYCETPAPESRKVFIGGRGYSMKSRDASIEARIKGAMAKAQEQGLVPPCPPSVVTPSVWARKAGVEVVVTPFDGTPDQMRDAIEQMQSDDALMAMMLAQQARQSANSCT